MKIKDNARCPWCTSGPLVCKEDDDSSLGDGERHHYHCVVCHCDIEVSSEEDCYDAAIVSDSVCIDDKCKYRAVRNE